MSKGRLWFQVVVPPQAVASSLLGSVASTITYVGLIRTYAKVREGVLQQGSYESGGSALTMY